MSDAVETRVIEIAADVFGVAPSALEMTSTPDDLEEWDSFAQLNLLVALEDEYGIRFEPDDLGQLGSLGAIATIVTTTIQ
jgi:acyl carrier protein